MGIILLVVMCFLLVISVCNGVKLEGKVTAPAIQECSAGPKEIKVTLKKDGVIVAQKMSDDFGEFTFEDVAPQANYEISASHDSLVIENKSQEVIVENSDVQISKPFSISGYQLSGRVLRKDSAAASSILYLGTKDKNESETLQLKCMSNARPVIHDPLDRDNQSKIVYALCVARTNPYGRFQFKELPCGDYILVVSSPANQVNNMYYTINIRSNSISLSDIFVSSYSLQEVSVGGV